MTPAGGYIDFVLGEVLRLVPDVTSRAMFGGHGNYSGGTIFAIVIGVTRFF